MLNVKKNHAFNMCYLVLHSAHAQYLTHLSSSSRLLHEAAVKSVTVSQCQVFWRVPHPKRDRSFPAPLTWFSTRWFWFGLFVCLSAVCLNGLPISLLPIGVQLYSPRNDSQIDPKLSHFSSCQPRNDPQGIREWRLNMGLWIAFLFFVEMLQSCHLFIFLRSFK